MRTISDKILKDRANEIARNRNHNIIVTIMYIKEHQQVWSISFFDKKMGESINEQLAEELHKTVIKKFKRTKVYARI